MIISSIDESFSLIVSMLLFLFCVLLCVCVCGFIEQCATVNLLLFKVSQLSVGDFFVHKKSFKNSEIFFCEKLKKKTHRKAQLETLTILGSMLGHRPIFRFYHEDEACGLCGNKLFKKKKKPVYFEKQCFQFPAPAKNQPQPDNR